MFVDALDRFEYQLNQMKLELDMKNCDYHPTKKFFEEA